MFTFKQKIYLLITITFETIPNRKHVRQILAYPDSAIRFSHIFISLTSFMAIPNSMRILYKMGGAGSAYGGREGRVQGFGGKPEGRRPLGRPRRRWEDNIKMDLQEV